MHRTIYLMVFVVGKELNPVWAGDFNNLHFEIYLYKKYEGYVIAKG